VLVSKDVNVQLKARAAGLHAEDYLSDHVDVAEDDLTILDIDGHAMQRFASTGELDFETGDLYVNEYLLCVTLTPARLCLRAPPLRPTLFG